MSETAADDVEPENRIGGVWAFPAMPTWTTTWTTPSSIRDISTFTYETTSDPSFGLKPVAQFDGSGNLVSQFVYGAKGTVPDYILNGGNTYRVVSDHLGSPRLVVNVATGAVAEELSFDQFGNVTNDSNPGFQPFGFAGGLLDGETGLVRFGARDLDPRVGRWTAKDPLGLAAGLNVYVYAHGDPINWVDPSGLSAAQQIWQELEEVTQELAPIGAGAGCLANPACWGLGALLGGAALVGTLTNPPEALPPNSAQPMPLPGPQPTPAPQCGLPSHHGNCTKAAGGSESDWEDFCRQLSQDPSVPPSVAAECWNYTFFPYKRKGYCDWNFTVPY